MNGEVNSETRQALKEKIGSRFREMRIYTGLSQKETASVLGMSQANIVRLEKGVVSPNMSICHYFKTHYNIDINWLISGRGNMVIKEKSKAVDYGEFCEEMDDLFFHLDRVPEVRLSVLKFFLGHKLENKKQIQEYIRNQKVIGS
jgi:DNA-binding XRE family transcriptional regulator